VAPAQVESFYYEISHDSLAQSVANSRRFRIPKQVWYGGAAFMVFVLFGFLVIGQQLRVTQLRAEQAEIREQFLSDQLAKNFWTKALHERDETRDPLKASHYFMRAATHATQPGMAQNAQLAGALLVQNSELSDILSFPGGISDARFRSDGKGILTKSVLPESSKTIWSPDGKRFLSWSPDGRGTLWERDSDTVVAQLVGHESAIWGAVFHPDGDQILTWGGDGTARLWDPVTAMAITLQHEGVVRGATYSPDGHRVLTWSDDGTARVWDRANG
jgi:hypothetical protein